MIKMETVIVFTIAALTFTLAHPGAAQVAFAAAAILVSSRVGRRRKQRK